MKILVTGSNGFIAKKIIELLISKNTIFGIGIEKYSSNDLINYKHIDISNEESINDVIIFVKQCDVIIHTAACIDYNNDNNNLFIVNCIGTNNILRIARDLKCRQVINISSIPIIGEPKHLPITEDHELDPKTTYHITKLTSELIINQSKMYGIKAVNIRIPSPVGVGMNERTLLPIILKKCLEQDIISLYGTGSRKQNYIDVIDIASAISQCIENGVVGTYNIASKNTISNWDLARLCIKITESKSKIELLDITDPDDNFNWDISINKANNEFGFEPHISLEDSIKRIFEDMKLRLEV